MVNFRTLIFCAAAVVPLAMPALADDPFMTLTGGGLPPAAFGSECAYPPNEWCGNIGTAVDPNTSTSTLVYLLSEEFTIAPVSGPSGSGTLTYTPGVYQSGVQPVTTGDLIIQGTSGGTTYDTIYQHVLAVVAFENITENALTPSGGTTPSSLLGTSTNPYGTGPSEATAASAAFLYAYNSSGPAAGLPSSLTLSTNISTVTISGSSGLASYDPTSGQAGYGLFPPTSANGGIGEGDPANNNAAEYAFQITAPEPDAVVLTAVMLGMVLLGMVGFRLRRQFIPKPE